MFLKKNDVSLLDKADVHTRARDAPLFKVKVPRTESYKRNVTYNGAVEWNNLDVDVRNVDQILPFKFRQKRWLIGTI